MTTASRHTDRPRWVLAFLAAVLAVAVGLFAAAPASAATTPAAQNGVGASNSAGQVVVGSSAGVVPGQRLGNDPSRAQVVVATGVAANTGFATARNEAVFWSGIRSGDQAAASWAAKNGGMTLESTMAQRGITLPAWDASNPSVVTAWRQASAEFARGAQGNVTVLQDAAVRTNSVWAQVEYPALTANPNVTSITAVNPATGSSTVLWTRP